MRIFNIRFIVNVTLYTLHEVIELDYEALLAESDSLGLLVKEKPLQYNDGRIKGKRIAIRKDIDSSTKKACVLAEELGHYHTTAGDILLQATDADHKQEHRARVWAYNKMVGLPKIIEAYKRSCSSLHETAEYLNVTEEFLSEALQYYKNKYGLYTTAGNYIIYFEPALGVFELI